MLFAITPPPDNQRSPRSMQQALAAIHQALNRADSFQLEFGSYKQKVGLFCRVKEADACITEPLRAKYPNCEVAAIGEDALDPSAAVRCDTVSCELVLAPELFPLLRHAQFEDLLSRNLDDPIENVLRAVKGKAPLRPRIIITASKARLLRCFWAQSVVQKLNSDFLRNHPHIAAFYARRITSSWWQVWRWLPACLLHLVISSRFATFRQLDMSAGRNHEREDDIQAAKDKIGGHLFEISIRLQVSAPRSQRHLAIQRLQAIIGAFGSFTVSRLATFRPARLLDRRSFLLSHEELATLWHPLTASVQGEALHRRTFTELEAPTELPNAEREEGSALLGRVKYGDDTREFGLSLDDRRRHLYVIGKTGMGKTTLLKTLINADIAAGRGVCVIDPHGDLAADTIARIPSHRTNDVIVFDPSDTEFAISFNPLACSDSLRRDLVADDVHSAFDRIYGFSTSSPRMSDALRNALYVLIERQKTLLHLLRFFSDAAFQKQMLSGIDDDVARMFWEIEFPSLAKQERSVTVAAIQNKIRPFLMNRNVRAIVSQTGKSLDLRSVMDEGKILIVNLSKGRIGEGNARLLGALLVAGLQQAAMSRVDIAESERRDFFAYIDEFQNFTTGSFETILSEARKYRLNLTIAHQFLGQLDRQPETLKAVFGNVGSMVAFQVGGDDALALSRQLSKTFQPEPQVKPEHLMNIPKYHAYARLLINGSPSDPFSMATVQLDDPQSDRVTRVVNASRRHMRPMANVWRELQQELNCISVP